MRLCVLISCMHQVDCSIVERSNVQCDCVVINQCDVDKVERFTFKNKFGQNKECVFIHTTERGLSKSRNMAINHAPEDCICLLCDDDETFADDIEDKISAGYRRMPHADLIAFSLDRRDLKLGKKYSREDAPLTFRTILNTSSLQITFRKNRIDALGIRFDEKMGSGTGNGGGEENKFMLDIRKTGGRLFYAPECIAVVNPGESQWFKGYTPHHMQNVGWSSRRSMGTAIGFVYVNYWVLTHRRFYKEDISFFRAYINVLKGYFQKR